ncbi:MAG: DUF502 domain-containing protein [Methylobacteriaceae bacterium]|nr:DUF502 domain-containing protein [Methylobacteriaceae bacterium]
MTADPNSDPPSGLQPGVFFSTAPVKPVGPGARLRNYFLTGIIVFGPLAVTAYIVWWFVDTVDNWVKPLIPTRFWPDTYFPMHVPGFGLIIGVFGLTVLGFLTANLVGRTFLNLGELILDRMPIVRGLYKSLKQIFETVFSKSGTSFRKVGLVQFYGKGIWTVVFISAEPRGPMLAALPEGIAYTAVFLPCTPNPTSGFFLYVPTDDIIPLPITPDDAFKIILSAGVVQPNGKSVPPPLETPRPDVPVGKPVLQPARNSLMASSRSNK